MNDNIALKKNKISQRKARKIALLFLLTGITAILLIVETYAWFVGTSIISVSEFSIGVSSGDSLELSLDGENWSNSLDISKEAILGTATGDSSKAYSGNTNIWPLAETGLIPISTDGASDPTAGGRLKLYGKSSMTGTGGGYRLMSTRIDNYTTGTDSALTSEKDGYVAFDMFIRNGTGVDYIEEYNQLDDEALYLTTDSEVTTTAAGNTDYGLANSVRVAFVQIGRIASNGATVGDVTSITCGEEGDESVTNTSLCTETDTTIWEPNQNKHDTQLVTYFNQVCKKKTAATGQDATAAFTYGDACEALAADSEFKTYVVNQNILSSDNVDIYDGLNGYTGSTKLTESVTFTDGDKIKEGAERPAFFYLAPNSITKIRVYIYLEGQDVDNYDLASLGNQVNVQFGFTKDQWDLKAIADANAQENS